MIPRVGASVLVTALRCLPLTVAWVGFGDASNKSFVSSCEATPARTYQTAVDQYYRTHGELPLPKQSHVVLCDKTENPARKNVLVIGDVHGCFDELLELHRKAVDCNDGKPFQYVILVGDLVNKGPHSAKVVGHGRMSESEGWRTVRGNHENGALKAALSDESRRQQAKYQWIMDQKQPLSDEDVEWMSDLPYTIRIPGRLLGQELDVIIVHAGLIPGKPLEQQSAADMTNLRDVKLEKEEMESSVYYTMADKTTGDESHPWASLWRGPEHVIFGHDAKRGLQEHECATGLDTGACYGKMLTGLILPQRRLVHVHSAAAYSKIGKTNEAQSSK
jgi:bis(5'-nucleosyl)-tetraphosphatase (symmetrical)